MPQISIIIPVYKVEQYLRRCLDSVLLQTFTDYECILIDDASPDNCPAICDEYTEKDMRFKVMHKQNNEGLPKARKSGMDIAISDFVMHVDSDDWIEPNTIELLYKKQRETNADIVIGNYRELFPTHIKKISYVPIKNHENTIEWFILCEQKYIWGKLYRKSLFNSYIVPKTTILEDATVNIQLFSKLTNDRIQFIDEVIYNYDRRISNSLLSQMTNKSYNSFYEHPVICSLLWINDFLRETMTEYDDKTNSAFKYLFLMNGVIPYLKKNHKISKDEIHFLYENYYKNCLHLKLFKSFKRVIMPLYRFSIITGKMYIFIYNSFFKIRGFSKYLYNKLQVKHENQ
jgi:glycosyltransferase involved in cell wall biosynthesis